MVSPLFIMTLMLSCGFLFWRRKGHLQNDIYYRFDFISADYFITAAIEDSPACLLFLDHESGAVNGAFPVPAGIKSAAWSYRTSGGLRFAGLCAFYVQAVEELHSEHWDLLPIDNFKLNFLSFFQLPETIRLDCGKMDAYITSRHPVR